MMKRTMLAAMLLGSAGLWSASALAATCSVSAGSVAFGVYDPLSGGHRDSSASATVECTASNTSNETVNYTVRLSSGSSGSFTPRAMSSGGDTLEYNLYTDSARTAVWGDGAGATVLISDSITFSRRFPPFGSQTRSKTHTIHGRVFGAQFVSAGSYSDTITATVLY